MFCSKLCQRVLILASTLTLGASSAHAGFVQNENSGHAREGTLPDTRPVNATFQPVLSFPSSTNGLMSFSRGEFLDTQEVNDSFARFSERTSTATLLSETSFATRFELASVTQATGNFPSTDIFASSNVATLDPGTALRPSPTGTPASSFVPEPSVLVLLAAGIPAIVGRRPRHRP